MEYTDIAYAVVHFMSNEQIETKVSVRYPAFWGFYHLENRMKQCCDVMKVTEINETLNNDWSRDFI